jgi:hypothetical protein
MRNGNETKGRTWMSELKKQVEEMLAEHRRAKELIPLHPTKKKKRVAKSELWSRGEREELSRLAEEFLKAKKEESECRD